MVIQDGEEGTQSDTLAWDIVTDARTHGSNLGIIGAEFQASSGSSSNQSRGSAGMVVGVVFGVLIVITLIIVVVVLIHMGIVQVPSLPSLPSLNILRRNTDVGELGGPLDRGFDNPIFDNLNMLPDIPGLCRTETNNSISLTQTGIHFVNPVYDENETDFNA